VEVRKPGTTISEVFMRAQQATSQFRSTAGIGTAVLLFSLIVSAVALLGTDLLGGQSLPTVSESPFTFDVPALALAQEKIDKDAGRAASQALLQPDGEVVVLDDWNYTAIVRGRPQPSKHHKHHHH
jgi:hypothetical protein